MKKILVLIFVLLSSNVLAHIEHYKMYNKIEMDIFRNGELIGHNYYFFRRKDDETIITNQINFSVKLLGAIIFKVEGHSEEKYIKNQLVFFKSETLQNDRKKFVNLVFDKDKNKYNIKGSSYSGEASINNIIGNWWNHKILQTESQISPLSGSIKKQKVLFVGKESLVIDGTKYLAHKFNLKSKNLDLPQDKKLDFEIWYDPKQNLILKVAYNRLGKWEYILKKITFN